MAFRISRKFTFGLGPRRLGLGNKAEVLNVSLMPKKRG